MSMVTYITGFRPPDEAWRKMKAVWDACLEAGVEVPPEVAVFFGHGRPDPAGVEVPIPARAWKDGMRQGFEIDVADIPAGMSVIRFYNSW